MTKPNITPRRRAHLELLAAYLEGLPPTYTHFNMGSYIGHEGSCEVFEEKTEEEVFKDSPQDFLSNCGAVACAVGHGPAAGIPLSKAHVTNKFQIWSGDYEWQIDWSAYATHNFFPEYSEAWDWCFGGDWESVDNHHYGAAARIRYLLAGERIPLGEQDDWGDRYFTIHSDHVALYAPYRKAA